MYVFRWQYIVSEIFSKTDDDLKEFQAVVSFFSGHDKLLPKVFKVFINRGYSKYTFQEFAPCQSRQGKALKPDAR